MPNWKKVIVSGSSAALTSVTATAGFTGSFSGSVAAPGATTQVVFNNGGVLGADSGFVYSGNIVGIGTSSPQSGFKLDVNGSTVTRGPIYTNGPLIEFDASEFRIDTSGVSWLSRTGTLSVGATSSLSAKLGVRGSGATSATTALRVENTNASASLVVLDDGNVGIGTTNPTEKLEVQGSAQIGNDSVASAGLLFARKNSNQAKSHYFLSAQESPTYQWIEGGYFTSELAGVSVANNSGKPYYESYSPAGQAKSFGFINQQTSGSSFTSTAVTASVILYQGGTIALAPTLGNVGIGTTNPASPLQIGSVGSTSYAVSNGLAFGDGTRAAALDVDGIGATFYSSAAIRLNPGTTEAVRITAGGSVGIGISDTGGWKLRIDDTGGANLFLSNSVGNGNRIFFLDQTWQGEITHSGGNLLFKTGGTTERMRITYDGNVGIGTTNPTSHLQVRGSGATSSTTALRVENTNASASMVVLDDGNVGIGTATPSQTLTVNGNISASGDLIINTGSNQIRIGDNLGDDIFTDIFKLYNAGINGFLGTYFYNSTLELKAGASGSSFINNWSKIEIKDNFSSTGYIRLFTSGSERVRIANTGNVGIGTITPSASLHISGASSAALLEIDSPAVNNILFVSGSGNVGIGTGIPTSRLTVSGAAGTNSAIYAYKSGSTVLDIQGSQGQLFSVIDALSGSLMSVNDVSGLPILEVFSDDRVVMGTYGAPALTVTGSTLIATGSLLGTASYATTALSASYAPSTPTFPYTGSARITGSLTVTGSLIVSGSSTLVNVGPAIFSGSITQTASTASFGGLVGIGTGSPSQTLDVQGNINIGVSGSTTVSTYYNSTTRNQIVYTNNSSFEFFEGINERMRFGAGSGNLLLNTITDAGYKLDVNGSMRVGSPNQSLIFTPTATSPLLDQNGSVGSRIRTTSGVKFLQLESYAGDANYLSATGAGLWIRTTDLNTIYFRTNNTTAGQISTNQNWSIGSTIDAGYKLDVNGSIRATQYVYANDAFVGDNLISVGNTDLVLNKTTAYNILLNTSGSERMRVNSIGNVGIGTTNPTARLQVKGSGATSGTTALRVENTNASASLVVLDNGNVGIGTTSPVSRLEVVNASSPYQISLKSDTSTAWNMGVGTSGYYQEWFLLNNGTTEIFRINGGYTEITNTLYASSNLGIGKIPNAKLDVSGSAIITGSLTVTGGITGSLLGTASFATSASYAATASLAPLYLPLAGGTISGNVTVLGTASINTLIVNQIGYSSGSNQLGDAADDTQTLYGSVIVPTGSLTVTGSLTATNITPTNITTNYFPKKSGTFLTSSALNSLDDTSLNWGPTSITPTTPNARDFNIFGLNYSNLNLRVSGSTGNDGYAMQARPGGGFAFSNIANNTQIFALASDVAVTAITAIGSAGNIAMGQNGGNVGINWPNAYTIPAKFYVSGSSRFDGAVTINGTGTTSATTALTVQNANASSSFTVLDNGNVGIGTTAPSESLDVRGSILIEGNSDSRLKLGSNIGTQFSLGSVWNGIQDTMFIASSLLAPRIATFQSDGKIGIGTILPSASLHISGASSTALFEIDSPEVNNILFVSGSGNVGIGTGTPSSRLSVVDSSGYSPSLNATASANFNVSRGVAGATDLVFTLLGFSPFTAAIQHRHAALNGLSYPISLNPLGGNVGIGTNSPSTTLNVNGTTFLQGGQTTVRGSGATSATTALRVENTNASSSLTVLDNGNVGIGTSTPGTQLEVRGSDTSFIKANVGVFDVGYNTTNRVSLTQNIVGFNSTMGPNGVGGIRIGDGSTYAYLSANGTSLLLNGGGGNVGIGTISPSASLHISGASSAALLEIDSPAVNNILYVSGSGNIGIGTGTPSYLLDVNGTARVTTLIETSAAKYKTNIQPLDSQLSKVTQLEPVTFDWINKPNPKTNIGLIADEVEKIYPEFVSKTEDGEIEGIEYSKLTTVLIQSIKELKEIVDKQQEQINTLLNK